VHCSVYVGGKSVHNVGKSTYGERVGFSAAVSAAACVDDDAACEQLQFRVTFTKNGNKVSAQDIISSPNIVVDLLTSMSCVFAFAELLRDKSLINRRELFLLHLRELQPSDVKAVQSEKNRLDRVSCE